MSTGPNLTSSGSEPRTIEPGALADRIAAGTAPVILDVRSGWEFRRGHVPGAVHIPFWRIDAHLERIPARTEDEIVVYCGHGPRAAWAEAALRRHGFRRVLDLAGHWARWTREKREGSRRADL